MRGYHTLYSHAMPADPRDDFDVLEGSEHMLFGLDDPYEVLRVETARYLAQTTPDLELERIECTGSPKWLTITRRTDPQQPELTVTGFGLCIEATLTFGSGYASEQAPAVITLLCVRWNEPYRQLVRAYVDLGPDVELGSTDEAFQHRLLTFRAEVDPDQHLR
jgi:hypothetical protein